jgi:PQQ-dependent catabolism-associated CXXCW motif protein
MRLFCLAAALVALGLAGGAVGARAQDVAPEPGGYRMEDYRSPTPATLAGARVVDTAEAKALRREGDVLFLDTMPRDVKPPSLPPGTIWRDKPRDNIPGSVWLANVGYGALSPEMEAYFRESLRVLTAGDQSRALLFYCRADCWMSWNAAKRALSWGYSRVLWFPAGTDGWSEGGQPLEPGKPYVPPPAAKTP